MRVLVAYGSKHGGTEGIAHAVGDALTEAGHRVDVRAGQDVDGLGPWDAVIVGGGLYAGIWQRGARRFVARHVDELRRMPVWFFSSGPLDESASEGEIPPTELVRRWMRRVGARGHATFGGRLDPEAKGPIARALVEKGMGGDFRDMERVRAWARELHLPEVSAARSAGSVHRDRRERRLRHALAGLALFTAVTAIVGGSGLVLAPTAAWMPPADLYLAHTAFEDYFVPGLLLLLGVALPNLVAALHAARRNPWTALSGGVGGGALTVWILAQTALVPGVHWLQIFYLVVGMGTSAVALALHLVHRRNVRDHSGAPAAGPSGSMLASG